MKLSFVVAAAVAATAFALTGGAWAHQPKLTIPDTLKAPAGDVLRLKAMGKGVQIYQCSASSDQPEHFEWKLQGPEAQLLNDNGKPIGKHYAGPTWEARDGSKVIGEVIARDDGPDAAAIPWLLLNAKSVGGQGIFAGVHSIQRLKTRGGKAPADSCDSSSANHIVRVPYSAKYYFYTAS
jgi:FtsP/CotA-like multicopper oxidase with cupredoxin domain